MDNALILANLRRLATLNAPITLRVPLITDFNASTESLEAIAEFILSLDNSVKRVDLLPYHTLGKAKYKALGRDYPWENYARLTDAEIEALAGVVESYGLTVHIGG